MLLLRGPKIKTSGLELGDGTVIHKTFRGESYEVHVARDGFVFQGERFASLSEIATRISGSRRNGPQFFGLRTSQP